MGELAQGLPTSTQNPSKFWAPMHTAVTRLHHEPNPHSVHRGVRGALSARTGTPGMMACSSLRVGACSPSLRGSKHHIAHVKYGQFLSTLS